MTRILQAARIAQERGMSSGGGREPATLVAEPQVVAGQAVSARKAEKAENARRGSPTNAGSASPGEATSCAGGGARSLVII